MDIEIPKSVTQITSTFTYRVTYSVNEDQTSL